MMIMNVGCMVNVGDNDDDDKADNTSDNEDDDDDVMNGGWMVHTTTRVVTSLRYRTHLPAGEIVTLRNCQKIPMEKI